MNFKDGVRGGMRGEIEVFRRLNNQDTLLFRRSNLIVNSGMDLLAAALSGSQFVNGMYMLFENTAGAAPTTSPDVALTAPDLQTAAVDPFGLVRVATLSEAGFDTTDDTLYSSNKVVFVAISDLVNPITGGADVTDGLSQFYGAALAYLDPDDLEADILFSAVTFNDLEGGVLPQIEKIAGAQVGIRWSVFFEQP